jgi:hypothetical protein
MARQHVLRRPHPPHLWVVIDEAALRRTVGGPATMRGQLAHLIEVARLPHVTIQVLPFTASGEAVVGGPVSFLCLPGGELPDIVYLEQLTGGAYLDKPAEVNHYRDTLNRLAVAAEPPDRSRQLLRQLLSEWS